ncbi:MAG: fibronectin type III domain-containing protein [candidate division Zixibacteria bacterium]|nr:fibronectin type III domain-containing protein [candidate division Zixibacteria bacterium]NIR64595.1 fibronectin type III domain-containing protein [candidate division Zixibacteria bacterium]NIS16718.1 fibronectin type III domain-containing protein [candidate division Zixibacteria bacterium]NIS46453.1 fibronectin type III domain-containing protein [candidate division Zixibacteria bacterium]NIT53107.1 fibronectin type III domain-containing protein [candidate division Zixibacteria bacterium]
MLKLKAAIFTLLFHFLFCFSAVAQTEEKISDTTVQEEDAYQIPKLAPVTDLEVKDSPDDAGGEIELIWDLSSDDIADDGLVSKYIILRSQNPAFDFHIVGVANHQDTLYIDKGTKDGTGYYYKVVTFPKYQGEVRLTREEIDPLMEQFPEFTELGIKDVSMLAEYDRNLMASFEDEILGTSNVVGPVKSSAQWFNSKDLDTLIIGLIICTSVVIFIAMARGGRKLFLRRIGGLQAIENAIGRATEMGKSILFIPGIQDMDDVQTVAGITILGRVAKTIAEYDTKINMPVSRSIVMTTARETIKEAYLSAGRPDAYSDDMVHYITDEQFGYVAAVDGIMVREKPATCFYLGAFFAESLIMAETGNSIGAIQIAGTAMPAQLPFFVAACDYTLIGEELFAASAYLSGEPKQLGSLKGQDVGKFIAMVFIILGTAFATLAALTGSETFVEITDMIKSWFSA